MCTMGFYSVIKMKFCCFNRRDLEIIILSEANQTEKDKYHDILYMWNLKKTLLMNIFINTNQKQTHRHRKSLWLPKRKGWKRGKQDYEINRYTGYTLYKINNKGLLHSTENYIQYLVITYSGKESEKIYV